MAARPAPGEHSSPGLLPWQIHFLAAVAGMLVLREGWAMAAAALGGLAAARLFGRSPKIIVYCCCFLLGLGYAWLRLPAHDGGPQWVQSGPKVLVTGTVAQVVGREGGRVQVVLSDVRCQLPASDPAEGDGGSGFSPRMEPLPGGLVWTWQHPGAWPVAGQRAAFTAAVKPVRGFANPGTWDVAFHWGRQGVFHRAFSRGEGAATLDGPGDLLERWRAAVRARIVNGLGGVAPDGWTQGRTLLLALLIGDRSGLSPATVERMTDASLAHTLSISGSHLAMVAGFGWGLAWLAGALRPRLWLRMPRPRLAALLAAPLVAAYWWLGGGGAALDRSALMFASFAALLLLGRGRVLLDGLFLAVAVILVADPLAAQDSGLQLSALAVAGIGLFAAPLTRCLERPFQGVWPAAPDLPQRFLRPLVKPLAGALAVSIAANLLVQPLVCRHFGQFSPNILWNLLWLPVMGMASMPLGFAGTILAFVPGCGPAAAQALALGALPLDWLLRLLEAAAPWGLAGSVATVRPGPLELAGWLLLMAVLAAWGRLPARRRTILAAMCCALLAGPSLWREARGLAGLDGVALTLLDVGQGQAALIEAPDGRRWLVDAGGGGPDFDIGRAVIAKALADGRAPALDGMLLSHPEADHLGGMGHLAREFRIGQFASGHGVEGVAAGRRLLGDLAARGVPVRGVRAGDVIELSPGLRLEVLASDDAAGGRANDRCVAVRLSWNGRGLALLPGDLERPGLLALLASGREVRAEALVLPHHGSDSSLGPEFYAQVEPRLALASAGHLNRYGFPGPRVREALAARGLALLATSECGAVRVRWAGPQDPAAVETALPCGQAAAR